MRLLRIFSELGALPPAPWDFSLWRRNDGRRKLARPPLIPALRQRSGYVPAVPYPRSGAFRVDEINSAAQ
jgi:hypothetical protein